MCIRDRTVGEFNRGHMKGFNNIPVDELRERISEIEKGKPVYLICQSGLRSYIASRDVYKRQEEEFETESGDVDENDNTFDSLDVESKGYYITKAVSYTHLRQHLY